MALLAAPALSWAGTGEPDDQLWTELDVVAPLASNTTITGIGQLRLSETLSNPIFTALGADVLRFLSPPVTFTITSGVRRTVRRI